MTFRQAQTAVDSWVRQYKEGYFTPLSNLARLTEEVGELARELNHRFGDKPKRADEPAGDLALELADILFVVICIANSQQIDLDEAFQRVFAKLNARDADRWTRPER
jgi:NTP pyrophosphatase (non-canonical NTP hydrolase)